MKSGVLLWYHLRAVDETTLETLEFPAVLHELASYTLTAAGREMAEGLKPLPETHAILGAFSDFTEVFEIIAVSGTLPLGGVNDIRPILSKIDLEGAYLLPDELVQIRSNISSSEELKKLASASFARLYPRTSARIEGISGQAALYSMLIRILDEKGEIKDGASPTLYRIRKEIRANKERARRILEDLTTDKNMKEYLQEDIISIRDDRYVLSIKAGMHTGFNGVIHGRSGSGATFFIEPLQLVELNNRVAVLKKEEKAEEIEILKEATGDVLGQREFLLKDLEEMSALDAIQAKALFAKELDAIAPVIKDRGGLTLKAARHPLLVLKEKRGEGRAIPVDISIPEDTQVLVISGANTGGKTVALKTLGLLTLMTLSGIPIPVDEGSESVLFRDIFSDIGDRQDIIASLSTFSAHIKRMKEFLLSSGPGSLVLIDEIGAGTDPGEGSAFALASLETLRQRGAVTVITTHLNLLKAQAQIDPRYMNASVEFDEKTLKPLYRLHYGIPGPSLGLSIAQSLGIPEDVIRLARGFITEKEGAFIESVRILEEQKEEVRKLKERLTELEARRQKAVERLREDRGVLVEKAKKNIDSMVTGAREEIRKTLERLKEEKAMAQPSARAKAISGVEEAGQRLIQKLSPKKQSYAPVPGDKVMITGSNTKGVVLSVDAEGKKAELSVGKIKVWAPWDKLIQRGGAEAKKPVQSAQGTAINADMEVTSSLNIIGMRAEEAIALVTKYVDSAHASGLETVEIIHGIGTGRLSKVVEEYLKDNRVVKRFYHAEAARGGAGVTIVELK